MKLHHYLVILSSIIFVACQSSDSANEDEKLIAVPTQQTCYTYIKNKDTLSLMMINSGSIVTGELNYEWFEKDKNTGIIRGEMKGDTLIADYIFDAEGVQSTRQVAFLKKDGQMLEGYGEVVEKEGKTVFKTLSALKFDNNIILTKVDCK